MPEIMPIAKRNYSTLNEFRKEIIINTFFRGNYKIIYNQKALKFIGKKDQLPARISFERLGKEPQQTIIQLIDNIGLLKDYFYIINLI